MHNIYSLLHQTSLNFPLCCPTLPLMLFVILLFGIKYYTMHCLCDVHKFHLGLGTCFLVLCDVNLLVNPCVVFVVYVLCCFVLCSYCFVLVLSCVYQGSTFVQHCYDSSRYVGICRFFCRIFCLYCVSSWLCLIFSLQVILFCEPCRHH